MPTDENSDSAASAEDFDVVLPTLVALLMTTQTIEDFLTDLARAAAAALDVSCGITVRTDRQMITAASSDALAVAVDEVQYGQRSGPCLQAMESGQIVSVPDMAAEQRWQDFPNRALQHDVHSTLSLPLSASDQLIGAMNLYASRQQAFSDPAIVGRAVKLADQGGVVLAVALRQAQQSQLTDQLREALVARSTIDQALGILMAQQHCGEREAFTLLRKASQHRHRKLRDLAEEIVTQASRPPDGPAPDAAEPQP